MQRYEFNPGAGLREHPEQFSGEPLADFRHAPQSSTTPWKLAQRAVTRLAWECETRFPLL